MERKTVQMIVALLLLVLGLAAFFWAFSAREAEAAEGRATTVASADGTPIHYAVWGRGEPTLVFVHCWSCDSGYWHDQIKPFAADHRLVMVDLAGHGASGQERSDYTIEAFARDVVAVMEAEDVTDAVLIGHSMGGPVVVETALAAPERVRGLIGIDNFQDMGTTLTDQQIDGFVAALRADFTGSVVPWVSSMFAAGADSALVARIAGDMAAAPPAVGISAITHTLQWMGGAGRARLEQLPVNLTTVSGDRRPTDVEGNRTVVPGFAVRIVPGTGHFPMLEKPAEFNRLLAEAVADFAQAPAAPQGLRGLDQ